MAEIIHLIILVFPIQRIVPTGLVHRSRYAFVEDVQAGVVDSGDGVGREKGDDTGNVASGVVGGLLVEVVVEGDVSEVVVEDFFLFHTHRQYG